MLRKEETEGTKRRENIEKIRNIQYMKRRIKREGEKGKRNQERGGRDIQTERERGIEGRSLY